MGTLFEIIVALTFIFGGLASFAFGASMVVGLFR